MSITGQLISAEDASTIGEAAKEAVRAMPGGRNLGPGDIDAIVTQVGGQDASLSVRMAMAGTMAQTIAVAAGARPINLISATAAEKAVRRDWLGLHGFGRDRYGAGFRDGGANGGDTGSNGASAGGGNTNGSRYDGLRTNVAASGVAPEVFDRYMRQYSGMGYSQGAVGTFAAVQLQAHDCKELEHKGYSRGEIIGAAGDAKYLDFKGKRYVEAAAEAKKEDPKLWAEDKKSLHDLETEKDPVKLAAKAKAHHKRFVEHAATPHARQREQMMYDGAMHDKHAAHAKADAKQAGAAKAVVKAQKGLDFGPG